MQTNFVHKDVIKKHKKINKTTDKLIVDIKENSIHKTPNLEGHIKHGVDLNIIDVYAENQQLKIKIGEMGDLLKEKNQKIHELMDIIAGLKVKVKEKDEGHLELQRELKGKEKSIKGLKDKVDNETKARFVHEETRQKRVEQKAERSQPK